MTANYTFVDAVKMNRENPRTFARPSMADLRDIAPGGFVKVGIKFDPAVKVDETGASYAEWVAQVGQEHADNTDGEKFWGCVAAVSGSGIGMTITAIIDNDLAYTANHGLKRGDTITFLGRNVLMAMTAQEMADESDALALTMPSTETH